MTTRVLVTGFEPFGGSNDNPSKRVAHALRDSPPPGVELTTGVLPVTWAGAWPALLELLSASNPELVILMGQSGKRASVTIERFALNFGQGRIADNDGVSRAPGALVDTAPLALPSSIDVDKAVEAIDKAGVPSTASHDAGAFLCNAVLYYTLLHAAPSQRACFIHLPMMPGQQGVSDSEPTLDVAQSEKAVRAVIAALTV